MNVYEHAQQLKPDNDMDLSDPDHDPLADREEEFVGELAVCNIGCVGRIEGRQYTEYGKWAWVGISITGEAWSPTAPTLLQLEQQEQLRQAGAIPEMAEASV